MSFTGQIRSAIRENSLLEEGRHVLAAVSGGADSVAMLHALCRLRPELQLCITVAHLNHGIRGDDALQDARFVRALADDLQLPCVIGRADVPGQARENGISIEMAAREARYRFLARTAKRRKADIAATAHTADDQAETLLLRIARGTGPAGLAGIRACTTNHGLRVMRPMLGVTHEAAVNFLSGENLPWREDATNRDTDYLRNRVRHEILPLLAERLNPRVRDALCRLADVAREEDAWMQELAGDLLDDCRVLGLSGDPPPGLDTTVLRREPLAARRRVLLRWLAESGIEPPDIDFATLAQLDALCASDHGTRKLDLGSGWRLVRTYDRLQIRRTVDDDVAPSGYKTAIAVPGTTHVEEAGLSVTAELGAGAEKRGGRIGRFPACASLSSAVVGGKGLHVRSWKPGDRIRPLGIQGTRKIQDIFVDAKIPQQDRALLPLVECGGDIVWVPGYQVARGWEVPSPSSPSIHVRIEAMAGSSKLET